MSIMIASPAGAGARPGSRTPAGACSAGASGHRTRAQPAVTTDAPVLRTAAAWSAGWQLSSASGAVRCRAPVAATASSGSSLAGSDYADYAALQGKKVYSAATGAEVELATLWRAQPGSRCVVVFLTHFADLSSTELAQKLLVVLPEVRCLPRRVMLHSRAGASGQAAHAPSWTTRSACRLDSRCCQSVDVPVPGGLSQPAFLPDSEPNTQTLKHRCTCVQLSAAGVGLLAVGLGEPEKARRFAELLQFPVDDLYAGEQRRPPFCCLPVFGCVAPLF